MRKILAKTPLFFCLFCLFFDHLYAASDPSTNHHENTSAKIDKNIPLTPGEKHWLKEHPIIRIGVDADYAPYSFIDTNGRYQGLAMDFIQQISKRLGVQMEVVPNLSWPEIVENSQTKNLDLIVTAVQTAERDTFLDFSQMYIPTPLVIMTRKKESLILTSKDITQRTVALVDGYSSTKKVIREHPDIQSHLVPTPLDGLMAVSVGEADAYVGVLGINIYLAERHGITNLKVACRYDNLTNGQRFGVRKDWPELVSILDKTLNAIPEEEKVAISNKWAPLTSTAPKKIGTQHTISLSSREQAWLKEHPHIRFGIDPEFHPFEYIDKGGNYRGISSDYIKLFNKRLDLNLEIVPGLKWAEVVEKAKIKEIDLLPCVGLTVERQQFLLYSQPYLEFQRVIITRADTPFITGIEDIQELRVAVQNNTSNEGFIKDHTNITPILYPTLQQAVQAVANNEADAFIGNIASSTYWIRKSNLTNLKIAAPASGEIRQLHFAVRKDWPELIGIINKLLKSITPEEKNKIHQQWVAVEYEPGLNPAILWKYVGYVILGSLLIFILFSLWNYKLKREISERKAVEKELQHRIEFEHLITKISSQFINLNLEDIDQHIDESLAWVGSFTRTSGCYLITIKEDEESLSCPYLWPRVNPVFFKEAWRELIENDTANLFARLQRDKALLIPSQVSTTEEKSLDQKMLQALGVQSIVTVPRSYQGKIIGCIGLCSPEKERLWSKEEINLLNLAGQIFTNALLRQEDEKARQKHAVDLEQKSAELEKSQKAMTYLLEDINEANTELGVANEKLKELDLLKSMFIASMSHELRTPLNSIIGFTGIILQGLSGDINDEQKDQLQRVYGASKHLLSLITDVIDISKIEAGRVDVYAEEFAFEKVVEEAVTNISPQLTAKGLELEVNIPDGVHLYTDQRRLLQCILNYLSNAVRYTEKGKIVLSATVISDSIEVRVSDSGIGIKDEEIPKLFNSFVRLDSHLKTITPGTGLGLYLTKKIATEMLGGTIALESKYREGSTFIFSIPLKYRHEEES